MPLMFAGNVCVFLLCAHYSRLLRARSVTCSSERFAGWGASGLLLVFFVSLSLVLRAGWGRRVIRPTGVSRDHGRLSPTCPVDTSTREQLAASPNAACSGGRSADEVEYAVVVHVVRGRGVADLAEGDASEGNCFFKGCEARR